MEIVEGTIGLVGAGTEAAKRERGTTMLSVLEVGGRTFQRIVLTECLSKFIQSGRHVRMLVCQGLTCGLVTRPFIAAIQIDGKTYKTDKVLLTLLLKMLLWMLAVVALGTLHPLAGVLAAACIIGFYVRNYLDFVRF
jgi:hypothetical protein